MNIGGAAPVPCVSGVQVCDFQGNTYMKHGDVQRASVAASVAEQRSGVPKFESYHREDPGGGVGLKTPLPSGTSHQRTPPVICTGPSDT